MSAAVKYLRDAMESIEKRIERLGEEKVELLERLGRTEQLRATLRADYADLEAAAVELTPPPVDTCPF